MNAHLRIARPTDQLEALVSMYRAGLGFEVIAAFEDHDGFDGCMLGLPDLSYHLEFTRHRGHPAGGAPSPEHLLVFYLPDEQEWQHTCQRLAAAGFRAVPSYNPYWEQRGKTFEDLEGYRVVLQNAAW